VLACAIPDARAVATDLHSPNDRGIDRVGSDGIGQFVDIHSTIAKNLSSGGILMNADQRALHLLELKAVSKHYGYNGHTSVAVRDVTLTFSSGELVLLLGPSGSGKTTLLTLMAGLVKPTTGDVKLFGSDVTSYQEEALQQLRAQRIGFVFQNFLLVDSLSVADNIVLVLRFGGVNGGEARDRAAGLLHQLGIEHLAAKSPARLSQGEKQRVAIARAIANGARLILADEPTASLESKQGLEVIELLQMLAHAEGRCVIVASHDLRLVEFADRVVRLRDGTVEAVERRSGAHPNTGPSFELPEFGNLLIDDHRGQ